MGTNMSDAPTASFSGRYCRLIAQNTRPSTSNPPFSHKAERVDPRPNVESLLTPLKNPPLLLVSVRCVLATSHVGSRAPDARADPLRR